MALMIYYFRMPDPDTKTTLQNWIDAGLSKPGKTNTELARLLGIAQSRVSEMRHGGRTPKISEIQTIALYIEEPIPDAYNPSVGLAAKLQAQRQLAEQLAEQRISPPDSIIFVDRSDKVLAPNACYVISNGDGEASYKRFRPNPMRFEPVSTNPAHEPIYPMREPLIVGRVKKSTIKM
jgi:transcriptional regulator with XRE-family HTH domain